MSKALTTLKQHLATLRDMYVVPAQAVDTRAEIRRIVSTLSFESATSDMRYEDLDSAASMGSITE